jgi:ParB family chromosome partitioning protein
LAFCVGRTVDAVKTFGGRGAALAQAEVLATATGLDMTAFWEPTAERYLSRVTKAHVLAAMTEAVSPDAARRLSGLKKGDLIEAAQPDLVKAQWLPALLRTRADPEAQGLGEDPVGEAQAQEEAPAQTPEADASSEPDLVAAE